MTQGTTPGNPPKPKISQMIAEMAAGFLGAGNTLEERQNRLNAAWNMACGPADVRQRQLEQYGEGYLRFNPATSPTDLANILKDMELLVERKLQMFPNDRRIIVSAKAVAAEGGFRIEVAAATV